MKPTITDLKVFIFFLVLLGFLAENGAAISCYNCSGEDSCDAPTRVNCGVDGTCMKRIGPILVKGCYRDFSDLLHHHDGCFYDAFDRQVCACNNKDYCNGSMDFPNFSLSTLISVVCTRLLGLYL